MNYLIKSILLIGIVICLSFKPGTNTAILSCKSYSGKTTFTAHLQDITGMFEGAKFTIDGASIEFNSNDFGFVVIDSKSGVFTLYVEGQKTNDYPFGKQIKLWAIPSTFKIIKEERGHKIYEFNAKIIGTDPRSQKYADSPVIELNCKLEWEI